MRRQPAPPSTVSGQQAGFRRTAAWRRGGTVGWRFPAPSPIDQDESPLIERSPPKESPKASAPTDSRGGRAVRKNQTVEWWLAAFADPTVATRMPTQRLPLTSPLLAGILLRREQRCQGQTSGAWQIAAGQTCLIPGARPTRPRMRTVKSAVVQRPSPVTSHLAAPGIPAVPKKGARPTNERERTVLSAVLTIPSPLTSPHWQASPMPSGCEPTPTPPLSFWS